MIVGSLLLAAALLLLGIAAATTQTGPFRPPRGRHWVGVAPGTPAQRIRWAAA